VNQKTETRLLSAAVIIAIPLVIWANIWFYGKIGNKDEVEALQQQVAKLEQRVQKLEKNGAIQAGTTIGNFLEGLSNGNN